MRIRTGLAAMALGLMLPGAALAMETYPVPNTPNFCPAGLQPVTVNGVICCGKPTTTTTYEAMMRHPVQRAHRVVRHIPMAKGVERIPTQKGIPEGGLKN